MESVTFDLGRDNKPFFSEKGKNIYMAQLLNNTNQEIFINFMSKGTYHRLESVITALTYSFTATFERYLIMTQERSLSSSSLKFLSDTMDVTIPNNIRTRITINLLSLRAVSNGQYELQLVLPWSKNTARIRP
jgi:hypothetical protein